MFAYSPSYPQSFTVNGESAIDARLRARLVYKRAQKLVIEEGEASHRPPGHGGPHLGDILRVDLVSASGCFPQPLRRCNTRLHSP